MNLTSHKTPEEIEAETTRKRNMSIQSEQLSKEIIELVEGECGDMKKTMIAATSIQRWYKVSQAAQEKKSRATWKIFAEIEYSDEQDELALYKFFSSMLNNALPSITDMNVAAQQIQEETEPGEDYLGMKLEFPMTSGQVDKILEYYREDPNNTPLHVSYLFKIFNEYKTHLKTVKNVRDLKTKNKPLVVVGDLHGSVRDLDLVLRSGGHPKDTLYVFNGDFVDRGDFGLEVIIILIGYALCYPDTFILNRGNHEDAAVNVRYGFTTEVVNKYKPAGGEKSRLVSLITDVFRWLPIAIVIDDSVLIVHGGISKEFDIDMLNEIDRAAFPSVLVPPELPEVYDSLLRYFMTMTTSELKAFEKETNQILPQKIWHWRYLMTLLWSDPQLPHGFSVNKSRGGGGLFGPDVTDDFLSKHNLKMLIRSHQCKVEGYDSIHDRKCFTIFSASNYYDKDSNKGAVLKFDPIMHNAQKVLIRSDSYVNESAAVNDARQEALERRNKQIQLFQDLNVSDDDRIIDYTRPKIISFQVDLSKIKAARKEDLVKNRHAHACMSLRYKLISNMAKLQQNIRPFEIVDHLVKLEDWSKIVCDQLHVELPWMLIRNDVPLVVVNDKNSGLCVNVTESFEKMQEVIKKEEELKKDLNSGRATSHSLRTGGSGAPEGLKNGENEYSNQAELVKLFEMLDSDNSGTLETKEMVDACKSLPMFNGVDVEKLAALMDFNKDGKVDLNEFMEAFRLVLSGRA